MKIKQPYPYFGGKSTISNEVWKRLGDAPNFVDPFMGGNSFLLTRPHWDVSKGKFVGGGNRIETVNDIDCFISNFWRAVSTDPEQTAQYADWPVNEADLHARHKWLVSNVEFRERMKSDPDYVDFKVAGWWVWGICQWIGSGWCETLNQQLPHLGNAGMGIHRPNGDIYDYFQLIQARLRRVRVCCGDWQRVLGPTPTESNGLTAIALDPPYSSDYRATVYSNDDFEVAHAVRQWAIDNGDNPKLRIALFGYADEHEAIMPDSWECLPWKAAGGYGSQNGNGYDNGHKERVWFSPHCVNSERVKQLELIAI